MSQVIDTDYGVETGTLAKARLIEEVAVRTLSEWRALRQSLFEQLIDSGNSNSTQCSQDAGAVPSPAKVPHERRYQDSDVSQEYITH